MDFEGAADALLGGAGSDGATSGSAATAAADGARILSFRAKVREQGFRR